MIGDDTRIPEIDTQNKIARLLQKAALVLTMRVRTTVLDIPSKKVLINLEVQDCVRPVVPKPLRSAQDLARVARSFGSGREWLL